MTGERFGRVALEAYNAPFRSLLDLGELAPHGPGQGWSVLTYSGKTLKDPAACAEQIAAIFRARTQAREQTGPTAGGS